MYDHDEHIKFINFFVVVVFCFVFVHYKFNNVSSGKSFDRCFGVTFPSRGKSAVTLTAMLI